MNLIEPIVQNQDSLQKIRRDIHAHPELRYEEERTSNIIAGKLEEWGIRVIRGLGKTGVVGVLQNGSSNKALGLRADMDALPMQESNTFAHASKHENKMHACGHDGHTAMLLGAAHYFSQHQDFDGTVYFIFQPAEESGAGARAMINDGLFEKCPMDAVYGLHNFPGIPTGCFGVRAGPLMAGADEFFVKITGKGGHAALPHKTIDPVMAAVQTVQSWQTIVSRNVKAVDAVVISVTQIHAGTATNVIPNDVNISGTIRTFSIETRDLIEQRMRQIAEHTANAFGAEIEFNMQYGYPPVTNHVAETAFAVGVMGEVVGAENVDAQTEPTLGSEDFAFMLQAKPGCYVLLGNGDGAHRDAGHGLGPCDLHNQSYDFNDELLPIGASYWVRLVQKYLKT